MRDVSPSEHSFYSVEAATGASFGSPVAVNTVADVEAACAAAKEAFEPYRAMPAARRAAFLRRIGEEVMALGGELISTAGKETGLPEARLLGERARTTAQLELFAEIVERQGWLDIRVDEALPSRKPIPRPDLRSRRVPLGPVAVFGASNFPFAFSTAGGDTASALAAGCPVVVRGHPAHPATGELVAQAVRRAIAEEGLPPGVFSHVVGPSLELGQALVRDPRIAAVGFTGSRRGGLALVATAQARPSPIPVFAEMSSINPVLLLPHALQTRPEALAEGFAQSLALGAGQFCTNPGLVIALKSEGLQTFKAHAARRLSESQGQTMLTPAIQSAYWTAVQVVAGQDGVETLAMGPPGSQSTASRAALLATSAEHFLSQPKMAEEMFGPASLVVECSDEDELTTVLRELEGQLTITLQFDDADIALAQELVPLCEGKAGRILCNGWPTGVEVSHAMVHGGPFPATSDGRSTSVGSQAIERFTRPVCYQNFPDALLPSELKHDSRAPKLLNGDRV